MSERDQFENVGKTLFLIREIRGLNQEEAARRAGMGKSQLSKYERGRELPKLPSLGKILDALDIGVFEFWYTLHLVDMAAQNIDVTEEMRERKLPPLLLCGPGLLTDETDAAFRRIMDDIMQVYHRMHLEKLGKSDT